MRVLPQDREDAGLQSVFKSIFPITDLRENCSLEFVDYSIGNWECKCGRLVGLDKLGRPCTFCAATIITDPRGDREIHCPKCGHLNENRPVTCETCDEPVGPEAQVRRGRVPGARHDVRRAPQGHHPPRGLGQGPGDGRQDHPRHQGAGGLLRRHPADDGERDLHHQRHGAGHRQPAPPLAGRLLLAAGEGPLRRPDHPLPRELGGVRVRRQEPAPRADRPQAQVPGLGVPAGAGHEVRRRDPQALLQVRPHPGPRGPALLEGLRQPRRASSSRKSRLRAQGRERASATRSSTPARRSPPPHLAEIQRLDVAGDRGHRGRPRGRLRRRRHRRPAHGRGGPRGQRGPLAARPLRGPRRGQPDRLVRGVLPRARRDRADALDDGQEGHHQEPRGGAHRDLPAHAPGRSADPRLLAQPLRGDVPERAEVRLLAGGPAQAQHQARPVDAAHREDPPPRGHRGGDRLPAEAAPQPAGRGRHRPPRQPPRAQRRRAAREPVPDRPRPHGARDQGEDERLPGDGHGHAPRPHQRQAGHGLDPRVLRLEPAQPVHGPDEPALGDHPQAAALRPRAGRPQPRARRLRGARRPPDPLRPHLPDRDPGRPEHRPHLEPQLLRPHQRVRVHREPVPQGEGRPGPRLRTRSWSRATAPTRWATSSSATRWSARTRRSRPARRSRPRSSPTASTSRPGRRTSTRSPRPTRGSTTTATSSTSASRPARSATRSSPSARRSTTSTSRRSSSSRSPRRSSPSSSTTTRTAR